VFPARLARPSGPRSYCGGMTDRWPDPPPLFDLEDAAPAKAPEPRLQSQPAGDGLFDFDALTAAETSDAVPVDPTGAPSDEQATGDGGLFDLVAVFDLETTGVNVERDRVVTAYVGLIDSSGTVLRAEHWLADPGVPIPEGAAAVHGITTEKARAEGRDAREVVAEIVGALRGLLSEGIPLVAYNASYDLSLLRHEAARHGVEPLDDPRPVVDPFVIDKALDRYRKGKRTLDLVAAHYGVALDDAHEASADAIAAGRVAIAIAARFADDLGDSLDAIHDQQVAWAREQAESLTDYFHRIGKIPADETIDGTWPVR